MPCVQRRAPLTLMPDWPEPVHPAAGDGLPSADDLDRADALRAAVADRDILAFGIFLAGPARIELRHAELIGAT